MITQLTEFFGAQSKRTRDSLSLTIWVFTALSMLALLSPIGASHDELFHAGSIWCANGVDDTKCLEVTSDQTQVQNEVVDFPVRYGLTPIKAKVCQRPNDQPLICPTSSESYTRLQINNGMYPSLYYKVMHLLVGPSVEKSIVSMRVLVALITSIVLGTTSLLLDPRRQAILLASGFVAMYSSGWYLAASINPSALSVLGVATSWIFLEAALQSNKSRLRTLALCCATAFTALLTASTRWDAVVYLLVSYIFVVILHFSRHESFGGGRLLLAATTLAIVAAVGVSIFTPLLIIDQLRSLFTYEPGQPDNTAFVSHYMLHALPKLFEAFGDLPTQSGIWLPPLVSLCGFVVTAVVVFPAIRRPNFLQVFLIITLNILISLVLMGHAAGIDQRDPFGPSHRYVLPLLPFAIGFLLTTFNSSTAILSREDRQWFVVPYTLGFVLMSFTVAERFVDKQSFGVRLIPESIEGWWWSDIPFGPNVTTVISGFAMYKTVSRVSQLLTS